jgi:hypothetical protein
MEVKLESWNYQIMNLFILWKITIWYEFWYKNYHKQSYNLWIKLLMVLLQSSIRGDLTPQNVELMV